MSAERNLTEHDYELLSAYIDGMLEDGEREALEARLSADARLRRELAALRQTVALVQQLPTLKAPRDFTLSIPVAAPTVTRPPADATVTLAPTVLTRPDRTTRRVIPLPLVSAISTAAAALLILAGVGLLLTNRADPPLTTQSVAVQATEPAPLLPEVAFTNAGELSTAERLTAAAPALAAPIPTVFPFQAMTPSPIIPGGAGGGGGETIGEGQAELETFGMAREGGGVDVLPIPVTAGGANVQTMPLTMTPAPTIGTVQELMQASATALATTTQQPVPVPQSTSAPPPFAAMADAAEAQETEETQTEETQEEAAAEMAAAEATEAAPMDAPPALAFALTATTTVTATPSATPPPTATQTPSATPIPAVTQERTPPAAPQGTPTTTQQTDADLLLPLALIGAGVALLAGVIALNVRRRA